MAFVRRQRAGSQEFGDKAIHEAQADYDPTIMTDEHKEEQVN